MAQFLVLCLILMDALWITAEAIKVSSSANLPAPASSPLSISIIKQASPQTRKLEKYQNEAIKSSAAPGLSPSEATQTQTKENMHFPEAINSWGQESATTQLQDFHMTKQHHHSFDKSVAGGGVILGGLGTTFLVAVVCYIRATRRKNTEPAGPGPVADVANV